MLETTMVIERNKWKSLSHVQLFVIPMDYTVPYFSRPEYWNG